MEITYLITTGQVLGTVRSWISPLTLYFIWQKYLLYHLDQSEIWSVSPQPGCDENGSIFRVTGPLCEFPSQRPWTRSFDVSLICAWINSWVNNCEAGDWRRHRTHYDVIVMIVLTNDTFTTSSKSEEIMLDRATHIYRASHKLWQEFSGHYEIDLNENSFPSYMYIRHLIIHDFGRMVAPYMLNSFSNLGNIFLDTSYQNVQNTVFIEEYNWL